MSEIKLGVWAKDKVTGFQGFVTTRYTTFSGMVQWGLQPYNEAGDKILDPMSFDPHLLEVIDGKGLSEGLPAVLVSPFKIGDVVKDKVTGFKGTITSEMIFLNGCAHYTVAPKRSFFNELFFGPTTKSFEWQRLDLIEKATLKPTLSKNIPIKPAATAASAAAVSTPEPAMAATGGPNMRIPSSRLD